MVIYHNVEVIKTEKVYPDRERKELPIECWATLRVEGKIIEVFMMPWGKFSNGRPIIADKTKKFPDEGDIVDVDIRLMTYDLYRINIEEKMLKQISTFPMDPIYVVMGKVVEAGEIKTEVYRGEKTKTRIIKVDCGILLDSKVDGWVAEQLQVGDYVAIIGKMFGEIVKGR